MAWRMRRLWSDKSKPQRGREGWSGNRRDRSRGPVETRGLGRGVEIFRDVSNARGDLRPPSATSLYVWESERS